MENEMLNAFKMAYREETIKSTNYSSYFNALYITCESGYKYKVANDNGNIIIYAI